jgi:hypothetical protein
MYCGSDSEQYGCYPAGRTYSSTTSRVLNRAACDIGDFVLFNDLIVQGQVLFLCKYGIVCLEIVLFQKIFPIDDLNIKQGVTDAKNLVGRRRHDGDV